MATKLDDKTIRDLRVFADWLRIDSIRSTNASKSGYCTNLLAYIIWGAF